MSESKRYSATRLCCAYHPESPENICPLCEGKMQLVWSSLNLLRWMGRPESPEDENEDWTPFSPTEALGFLVPAGVSMRSHVWFLQRDIGVKRAHLEELIAYLEVLSKFSELITRDGYLEQNSEARNYLRDMLNTDWIAQQQALYGGRQMPKPNNEDSFPYAHSGKVEKRKNAS